MCRLQRAGDAARAMAAAAATVATEAAAEVGAAGLVVGTELSPDRASCSRGASTGGTPPPVARRSRSSQRRHGSTSSRRHPRWAARQARLQIQDSPEASTSFSAASGCVADCAVGAKSTPRKLAEVVLDFAPPLRAVPVSLADKLRALPSAQAPALRESRWHGEDRSQRGSCPFVFHGSMEGGLDSSMEGGHDIRLQSQDSSPPSVAKLAPEDDKFVSRDGATGEPCAGLSPLVAQKSAVGIAKAQSALACTGTQTRSYGSTTAADAGKQVRRPGLLDTLACVHEARRRMAVARRT
eukprot:TRINITY_DN3801_c0_g1_i4.p2 TRINITY_DN3801_c0_g1~~TRINITY_DN3801_c0_g1_i4.p2  ORF type:complete len:296 (+),score=43.25 TRINITY_DN3801_c0_g1_i4:282-1169(+)